jgi:hypothetical protein
MASTYATKKFIKNASGALTEEKAVLISTITTNGSSADGEKLPALNSNGFLDQTIVNATVTSNGNGASGKVVALDANGKLDTSVMPTGIGADTKLITASEALAGGDVVNIWLDETPVTGGPRVRKADAATARDAHGFVLDAVDADAEARVYFEGNVTGLTGLVAGVLYLSGTTAGKTTSTAPSTATYIVQRVGFATAETSFNFQSQPPIVLA